MHSLIFVYIYFVVSLSFVDELLCEQRIPLGPKMCLIKIIFICTLDWIKVYSHGCHSMMVSRDR
jgi:hypothetical protein